MAILLAPFSGIYGNDYKHNTSIIYVSTDFVIWYEGVTLGEKTNGAQTGFFGVFRSGLCKNGR